MNTSIVPDTTPPTIATQAPAHLEAGINVGTPVSATFSEVMRASTITSSNVVLQGPAASVPATVSYDAATSMATLTPQAALQYGTTYTATVGAAAAASPTTCGNPLAADVTLDVRHRGPRRRCSW